MKRTLRFLLPVLFLLMAFNAFSQDTIVKIDGEKIQAKVLQINSKTVEYKLFTYQDGPLYIVNKSEIKYIKYQNGTVDQFAKTEALKPNYNRALKMELFSPLYGDIAFAYEQKVGKNFNAEIKAGFIYGDYSNTGASFGNQFKPQGAFFKVGIKLIPPQSDDQFHGFYIKPEFIFSSYSGTITYQQNNSNYTSTTVLSSVKNTSLGADLVFGYQTVINNRILLDSYFGWGLASTNINYGDPSVGFQQYENLPNYGFVSIGGNNGVNYSSRIFTIGLLAGYSF
ncbi:MAG: hypothetical protein ABI199_02760 [Bacteroidia bacterium]